MKLLKHLKNTLLIFTLLISTACGSIAGLDLSTLDDEELNEFTADNARLVQLENDLLGLINQEREASGLPRLVRDPGLDLIMLFYGMDMVLFHHIGHEDNNGRFPTDRVIRYGDQDFYRCSEITAWFSGSGNAGSHYNGYKNSQGHHDAYMEVGLFNLGPTTHVGVVSLAGNGPDGSSFSGTPGTYTGLIFCDQPVEIEIDPFEDDDDVNIDITEPENNDEGEGMIDVTANENETELL